MKKTPVRQRVNGNLRTRFFARSALLLAGGCVVISLLTFLNTRRLLMDEALEKSEVILQEVEAIRSYVQNELRPQMYALHGKDTFIIEAMSTTYVSVTIMDTFGQFMPDYIYRRASLNPHNPRNLADPFEEEMFDWFEADPERTFWQGIVKKDNKEFFISMVPDYFLAPCIRCHGKVEDAPESLVERYGRDGGFRFKEGDLAGIDSISIPVSASLRKAIQGSIFLCIAMLAAMLLWLFLFNRLFNTLVVERLTGMLASIQEKSSRKKMQNRDELDVLHDSLGSLRQYVRSAGIGEGLQPGFIGNYVAKHPLSVGAMSWLYHGTEANTGIPVSLKIGFAGTLKNPLYLACYETEMHLMSSLTLPNLPRVKETLGNVLVLDDISGDCLASLVTGQPLSFAKTRIIFAQLCKLVATLHAQGIVHHDLRPGIFFIDAKNQLLLTDMGLASSDLLPDPVTAAGLGPQGDPVFLAPEQLSGKRGDPRSDIYSLGVLLLLMSTGQSPFTEQKIPLQQWVELKEQEVIPESLTKTKTLPDQLIPIIQRAMSALPGQRYQWVEDFWEDVDGVLNK